MKKIILSNSLILQVHIVIYTNIAFREKTQRDSPRKPKLSFKLSRLINNY